MCFNLIFLFILVNTIICPEIQGSKLPKKNPPDYKGL
jgi:hypothetical protein